MKIYDCFTFYNEINILKLRLKLLNSVINKFVIVESNKTQNGVLKPFTFEKVKYEFSEYLDKIIYIKAEDPPDIINDKWAIEHYQRNCIMKGLINCSAEDLIIISDIDEFINPDIFTKLNQLKICSINNNYGIKNSLRQFLKLLGTNKKLIRNCSVENALEYIPITIQQDFFYYYMNNINLSKKWEGPVMVKFKNFMMPQKLRDLRQILPFIKTTDNFKTGWHFSYLGGKEKVKEKLKTIVEGNELIIPKKYISIDNFISDYLNKGLDIWNRDKMKFINPSEIGIKNVDLIHENFPEYFNDNKV